MSGKSGPILLSVVIGMVVAAIVGGLILLGPPSVERQRRLDQMRVEDLRSLSRAVDLFWKRHQKIPDSLEQLSNEPTILVKSVDPETAEPYEYRPRPERSYELCAHFAHDLASEQEARERSFWSHGRGRTCFELDVNVTVDSRGIPSARN